MGKKLLFVFCFFILHETIFSQEENLIRLGLIRAQLTISPSKMLSSSNSYFYLHGNLEGFLSEQYSVSGEGYFFQGIISNSKTEFNFNHNLFFGFSKHFVKNNLDFYIGIQPGISFTKLNPAYENLMKSTRMGINPLFSTLVGINYFFGKIFHFFVQTRLILGDHKTDFAQNLSEIRLSAGLGFNINVIRK